MKKNLLWVLSRKRILGRRISTQRFGRQRVSAKNQRQRKNEMMFRGRLFIETKRKGGGEKKRLIK